MNTEIVEKIISFAIDFFYARGLDSAWFLIIDANNPAQMVVLRKRDGSSRTVSFGYDPAVNGEDVFQVWTEGEIFDERRRVYVPYNAATITSKWPWQGTGWELSWNTATTLFLEFIIFAHQVAILDQPGDLTLTDADLLGLTHYVAN